MGEDFCNIHEIFPNGKMKYFLRKCEILLAQYEICLRHIMVSLRDDLKFTPEFERIRGFLHIFEENISPAKPISYTGRCIS